MNYLTINETALRWGVSRRTVSALCSAGRVEGAVKFANSWAIPEDAEKPGDPRKSRAKAGEASNAMVTKEQECFDAFVTMQENGVRKRVAMPLINTPFALGRALEAVEQIEDADMRTIALAEYYYFRGQSDKVPALVEPYLEHGDVVLRTSACFLYAYASLDNDRATDAKRAMRLMQELIASLDDNTPVQERAYIVSLTTGTAVLLHMPMPKIVEPLKQHIHRMPPGLRLFILYIEAHHAYLNKQYGVSIGIAETALALETELYVIPTIYLHLIAAIGYLNLKHPEQAKMHVLEAWEIARPDELIHPIAEHHGLVGGTLEATIKRLFPDEFKKIITLTYRFSAGWRKVHNSLTGNYVTDNLTTTEFAAAMLAARDWTNQEIAVHMGISEYTVRHYISNALQKLNVSQRKDLAKHLLT